MGRVPDLQSYNHFCACTFSSEAYTMPDCEHVYHQLCQNLAKWLDLLFDRFLPYQVRNLIALHSGRDDFTELLLWVRLQPFSLFLTSIQVHYIVLILLEDRSEFHAQISYGGNVRQLRESLRYKIHIIRIMMRQCYSL